MVIGFLTFELNIASKKADEVEPAKDSINVDKESTFSNGDEPDKDEDFVEYEDEENQEDGESEEILPPGYVYDKKDDRTGIRIEKDGYRLYIHGDTEFEENEIDPETAADLGVQVLYDEGVIKKEEEHDIVVDLNLVKLDELFDLPSAYTVRVQIDGSKIYETHIDLDTGENLLYFEASTSGESEE